MGARNSPLTQIFDSVDTLDAGLSIKGFYKNYIGKVFQGQTKAKKPMVLFLEHLIYPFEILLELGDILFM